MLAHVYGMQLLMSICFLKMLLVTSSSIYDYYDFSAGIDSETFPVCAEVTLTQGNPRTPDITKTIYDCVANIGDAQQPPSYYGNSSVVQTLISFNFNNLMKVDELLGVVTLDFFYEIFWLDPRINIPSLWDAINASNPDIITYGFEVKQMIDNVAFPLDFWLADVQMVDAKEVSVLENSVKVRPNGLVSWDRHIVATIQQPSFDYEAYPQDTQKIEIRLESFAYNVHFVKANFTPSQGQKPIEWGNGYVLPPPVHFTFDEATGQNNFEENPSWEYIDYSTEVFVTENSGMDYDEPVVYLSIKRRSAGIIYRLALPVMLMLLLVSLTFWSDEGGRVDSTITILLAISALYIVVFSSIPMLGYLTDFDEYIILMFLMVVIVIFVHQIVSRLSAKVKQYPLRQLLLRILEISGKTLLIPGFIIAFIMVFPQIGSEGKRGLVIGIACLVSLYILLREASGFRNDVVNALACLRVKIDNPAGNRITSIEILVFNFLMFSKISRSMGHYHQWKRNIEKEYKKQNGVEDRKGRERTLSERVNKLLHGEGSEYDGRMSSMGDFQMKVLGRETMANMGHAVYVQGGGESNADNYAANSDIETSVTRRFHGRTPESDDEEVDDEVVRGISAAALNRVNNHQTSDDVVVNSLHII